MGPSPIAASTLFDIEADLAATLSETVDEIEHMDCFDPEQRAELYTILRAMVSDTQQHRTSLAKLMAAAIKEPANV